MKIFGNVIIKATGFEENKLIEDIRNSCKVISLNKENDSLYIEISFFNVKKLISLCQKHDFVIETIREKGIAFTAVKYIKRYGIYLGVLLSIVLMFYFSNIAMRIEINGINDEAIIHEITEILESQGISSGAYIPSINFIEANMKLTTLCDEIAWSSIAHTGSVINVNVKEITPKEDIESRRIPSNIIAKRDGIIVKAEVLSGVLDVLVGDAVAKGDLLVSGIIERRNGVTYYYHSFGTILAQYDESIEINRSYETTEKHLGDTHYVTSLQMFDADFHLPRVKTKIGNFDIESDTSYIYFFGIKLPVGITTKKYTEVTYEHEVLSTEEAFYEAYRLLDNYEKNILTDEEIVSRSVKEVMKENGVALVVDYKLIGEIGAQQEIYAK